MPSPTPNAQYRALMKEVSTALSQGLAAVQKMVEYQRVKTYWTIGKAIHKSRIPPGEELYNRISRDVADSLGLDLTLDTLRRSVQFHKTYPVFPKHTPLTFTHYLALMRVSDESERARLEALAVQEQLSARDIKKQVLALNTPDLNVVAKTSAQLIMERGEPYVYVARPFEDLDGEKVKAVDCGFRIHVPMHGGMAIEDEAVEDSLNKSRYVSVTKQDGRYTLRLAPAKKDLIYTYAARVLKVVDGDTLDALIDVGFGIYARERVRLKGISVPEMTTRDGQRAKDFLSEQLASAPRIIIRTSKAGMYGRWLGDVFVLPGSSDARAIAAQGAYINQRMLDERLGERY